MSELWRCDICLDLIDPVEEDERAVLTVEFAVEYEDTETDSLDLCQECRPSSLPSHMDWMIFQMEGEDG